MTLNSVLSVTGSVTSTVSREKKTDLISVVSMTIENLSSSVLYIAILPSSAAFSRILKKGARKKPPNLTPVLDFETQIFSLVGKML